MTYIVWEDRYNIGVKEMDEQHKLFVGYVNELYTAVQTGKAETIVVPMLNKLTDYIQLHFTAEEELLKSINYPGLETEISQHTYFITEILMLKNSYLDRTKTAQSMFLFLKEWFLYHIMTEDLKFAEFIVK